MISLDHAVIVTPDLDRAGIAWRRLGFSLTPRGSHPSLGTANHTVVFRRSYVELLTVVRPTPAGARWAQALGGGGGLHSLALTTEDAAATVDTLAGRGVRAEAPLHFGRPVTTPAGSQEARFTVSLLGSDASPAFGAFFCQHHTPGLVWRPEAQHHANTALGVAGVVIARVDPEADGRAYERLLGSARVHPRPGGITLALGGTHVWLVRPDYVAARLQRQPPGPGPLGLTLSVANLDAARRVLAGNAVPYRRFGTRSVLIEPTFTAGTFLELVEH